MRNREIPELFHIMDDLFSSVIHVKDDRYVIDYESEETRSDSFSKTICNRNLLKILDPSRDISM